MQVFPSIALWSPLRTTRNHCLKAAYHMSSLRSLPAEADKNNVTECLQSDKLRKALMRGYSPIVRAVDLGKEAEYVTILEPRQRICYYPGKLHGGMQAFFLDNLFADCCQGALTANLTISYLRPTDPQATLSFRAWPVKVEGRKTYMEGCIKFLDGNAGVMVEAVRAKALFIRPRAASALQMF
ncbi:hypothetical protein KXV43_002566 [Aspergillus fumigatus]|nr:hypothetical protein KXV43_002566 [Aspergillus fumigatus]